MTVPRAALAAAGLACLAAAASCSSGGITPVRTPFNRGAYHQSLRQWDAAIAEYREALDEDSEDYRARFNLALSLEGKAADASGPDREAARSLAAQEYRRVLEQRPGDLRAGINLAAMEAERGETAAARARMESILDAHSDVAMPYTALAALELREGDLDRAESLLRSAQDIDAGNVQVNLLLGDCERRLGRPEEAQAAYQRAHLTDASEIAVPLALADLNLAWDRADEAVSWAGVALLLDADHAGAHRLMSRAQEALADYQLAAYHLRRARDLGPATPEQAADDHARMIRLYEHVLERERAAQ